MLKIRLIRIGKKHDPSFRVVLTPKEAATRSGKFIEILGNYNPTKKGKHTLNRERILYWISKGAQCSDTLYNLLVKDGIVSGAKRKINIPKPEVKEEIKEEAIVSEVAVKEEQKAEGAVAG